MNYKIGDIFIGKNGLEVILKINLDYSSIELQNKFGFHWVNPKILESFYTKLNKYKKLKEVL